MIRFLPVIAAVALISTSLVPALAGPECHDGKSFNAWLVDIRAEAKAAGIKEAAIESALAGIAFDPSIIRHDRGQAVFQQTFLQFSDRMVSGDRMSRGKKMLSQYAGLFD